MHDAALVVFTPLACILVLLPVPIHIRARNYATIFNVCWLFIMNFCTFINLVHFWDYSRNDIPVFCDISTKIFVGLAPALAACSLCINRRLAAIAVSCSVAASQRRRRVSLAVDIILCIIFPLIIMALSFIPQGQRFVVVEGVGCSAAIVPSLPSIFIVYFWPVVLAVVSIIYGGIAVKHFLARRLQFRTLLKSSQSGLTTGQYFRLMAVASADLVLGLPFNIAYLVLKIRTMVPWMGYDNVHANWGYVREVSEDAIDLYFTDGAFMTLSFLLYWVAPLLAFLFFIFFGVTEEAVREYGRWYTYIRCRVVKGDPRQSQQSDKFVPNLGTAIARPQGQSFGWEYDESSKDVNLDKDSLPSVGVEKSRPSLAVSVHVDRHVV